MQEGLKNVEHLRNLNMKEKAHVEKIKAAREYKKVF
jgi:hypothetical protein